MLQFSCSKEEDKIEENNIIFELKGTINGEAFDFEGNNLTLGESTNNTTNEITYQERSSFGNPVPIEGADGILFDFFFDDKPTNDLITALDGQSILESIESKPLLRIILFENGKEIISDFGENSDDSFMITNVEIATHEEFTSAIFETGNIIAITGNMKIRDEDKEIEGEFTLKLVELK